MTRPMIAAWIAVALLAAYTVPLRIAELAACRAAYIGAQAAADNKPTRALAARATAHTTFLATDDSDETD